MFMIFEINRYIYCINDLCERDSKAICYLKDNDDKMQDYVAKLNSQNASASGRIIPALKVDAKIEDNRSQFNY